MSNTENITSSSPSNQFGLGRLIAMGGASILLCISMFFSVLTPFPIGLCRLIYGRKSAYLLAFISIIVFSILSYNFTRDVFFWAFYISCVVIGLVLAELIRKQMHPVKSIFIIGSIFSLITFVSVSFYIYDADKSAEQILIEEIYPILKPAFDEQIKALKKSESTEAFEAIALISDPKALADQFIKTAPSMFFASLFITLWANMFMLLKSNKAIYLRGVSEKTYDETDLLRFKMPEKFVFIVIVSLLLILLGNKFGNNFSLLGETVLKISAVFYFFQGFGIYLAFLDRFNVRGIIRYFLVIVTTMSAYYVLAIIGFFDMFVDFNKKLEKKDN